MKDPELSREGETTRVDEFSQLGRWGNPCRRDNFSSYKHFGSPNRDNFRRSECHEMPKLREIVSKK